MNENGNEFVRASKALDEGSFREAYSLFRKAAMRGDASSQHNLGYCFDRGIGTRRNSNMALFWYKKAARNGELPSFGNIAKLYQERANIRQSIYWLKKAIAKDDGDAALDLAKLYLRSNSSRNWRAARTLIRSCLDSRFVTQSAIEEAEALFDNMQQRSGGGETKQLRRHSQSKTPSHQRANASQSIPESD